jgi:hypothetical protein
MTMNDEKQQHHHVGQQTSQQHWCRRGSCWTFYPTEYRLLLSHLLVGDAIIATPFDIRVYR